MSSETVKLHNSSCVTSKQTKINVEQVYNISQSTEDYNWINHEVIIDDVVKEQPSETDTINSDNHNEISGSIIQLPDHDYGFANSNSCISSITLRQDLFPDELNTQDHKISTVPVKKMSQTSRVKPLPLKTSSFRFILPKKRRKLATATNSNRKLKQKLLVQKQATKSEDISNSSKDAIIDLTDESKDMNQLPSSKFPVLLKKVDPKEVPLEIKEARNLLKSNVNIAATSKVNQVVLNHAISLSPQDPLLLMVKPNKVPPVMRTETNQNLVSKQELKELSRESSTRPGPYVRSNLKRAEILKPKESGISKASSISPEPYLRSDLKKKEILKPKEGSEICSQPITKMAPQEKVQESFERKLNLEPKPPVGKILEGYLSTPVIQSNSQKTPLVLKKVNSNKVPEQIKNYVPLLKVNTASSLHPQYSKANISGNLKEVQGMDISEVRLSSLANASQVSTVGSTTKTSTVLGEGIMKPSTSNNSGVADNNEVKVMPSESPLNHLTKELSNAESDCDEELGLNSLEELQQFWEFLVELHAYNKQVIRSQQNKRRRYILSIEKLERHLKEDLGLIFDEVEDKEDENAEVPTKEVQPTTEEEKVVEPKKNQPMEE